MLRFPRWMVDSQYAFNRIGMKSNGEEPRTISLPEQPDEPRVQAWFDALLVPLMFNHFFKKDNDPDWRQVPNPAFRVGEDISNPFYGTVVITNRRWNESIWNWEYKDTFTSEWFQF